MDSNEAKGNVKTGEAGHQGHDRQPVKGTVKSTTRNPEPGEAASAGQVQQRSKDAAAMQHGEGDHVDYNHPGPDRLEAEKSKGNVHHDQKERETDIGKVEGL